jgi:hypothetical protein
MLFKIATSVVTKVTLQDWVLQVGCSRIEERISQQNATANESPPHKSV